jgi:hypothetical protein
MDLRTSNILTCPTCRSYFSPDVKQLIKNFTILDYLYSERHVAAQQEEQKHEQEQMPTEKYCLKHPNKRTKFFCENEQVNICSKCIVIEHKGHNISDMGESRQVQVF